jgi:hypothetical protein
VNSAYRMAAAPDTLARAVAHMGSSATILQSVRREADVLTREPWTLAERDLIRLAAISRRHHLAYMNDCCTVTQRIRKGRPRPPK